MGQLLRFLYKYRAFFTFLLLEIICIWLIVANNNYQKTVYLNTASGVIGGITESQDEISDYFTLGRVNKELAAENARLRQLLLNQQVPIDSLADFSIESDSTDSVQYLLRMAEVIDNSVRQTNNFFMINKGSEDGIAPNMGVINPNGVVGKVRSVSRRYAHVISLLNTRNPISARLSRTNRFGTIQWDAADHRKAKLLFITRDVPVQVGDTVVTSSFNAVFPKDLMIGIVSKATPDPNQRDLDIEVELSVDFGKLEYVYVIENQLKPEKDSLAQTNPLELNE